MLVLLLWCFLISCYASSSLTFHDEPFVFLFCSLSLASMFVFSLYVKFTYVSLSSVTCCCILFHFGWLLSLKSPVNSPCSCYSWFIPTFILSPCLSPCLQCSVLLFFVSFPRFLVLYSWLQHCLVLFFVFWTISALKLFWVCFPCCESSICVQPTVLMKNRLNIYCSVSLSIII